MRKPKWRHNWEWGGGSCDNAATWRAEAAIAKPASDLASLGRIRETRSESETSRDSVRLAAKGGFGGAWRDWRQDARFIRNGAQRQRRYGAGSLLAPAKAPLAALGGSATLKARPCSKKAGQRGERERTSSKGLCKTARRDQCLASILKVERSAKQVARVVFAPRSAFVL